MADKEYIERGALLKTPPFTKYGGDLSDAYTEGYLDCAEDARMAVKCAPAADVVEVVRCKDCAWSRMIVVNGKPEYYCQCWNPGNVIHVDARGFCMWGERKEQT